MWEIGRLGSLPAFTPANEFHVHAIHASNVDGCHFGACLWVRTALTVKKVNGRSF
jgi:hypothetical protein